MVARSESGKSLQCGHLFKMVLTHIQTEYIQWEPRQECDTPTEIVMITMPLHISLYQSCSKYEYHQKQETSSPTRVQ